MPIDKVLSPRQRHTLLWTAIGLALVWVLVRLGPALTPFVAAIGLAYLIEPLISRLVRWRMPRAVAVPLVLASIVLAMVAAVLVVIPVLQREFQTLREQIPMIVDVFNDKVVPVLRSWFGDEFQFDPAHIREQIQSRLNESGDEIAKTAVRWLRDGGGTAMSLAGIIFIVPVIMFYLLIDWRLFGAKLRKLIPPRWRDQVLEFAGEMDRMLGQAVRGQLMVMGALSIFYCVALWLAGFKLWLPIGLVTGLLVFIPYIGFAVGLVLGAIAGFVQFGFMEGLIRLAIVYGVGQAIESFYLTPKMVGGRIGLHPAVVMFALVAFGSLFGIVGVLLALPMSAALAVLARRMGDAYVSSAFYRMSADEGNALEDLSDAKEADLAAAPPAPASVLASAPASATSAPPSSPTPSATGAAPDA